MTTKMATSPMMVIILDRRLGIEAASGPGVFSGASLADPGLPLPGGGDEPGVSPSRTMV